MWKFIILLAACYFLYRLFKNDFFRKKKIDEAQEKAEKDRLIAKGDMVKDPQCGTYVLKEGAISVKNGEQTWHFCSYDCRDAFLERLEKGGKNLPESEDRKD